MQGGCERKDGDTGRAAGPSLSGVLACNAAFHFSSSCSGAPIPDPNPARVYVNGREAALAEPKGMFLRRRLDITEQLGFAGPAGQQGAAAPLQRQDAMRNATLTVLVAPPDNVGDVDMGCGLRGCLSAASSSRHPTLAGVADLGFGLRSSASAVGPLLPSSPGNGWWSLLSLGPSPKCPCSGDDGSASLAMGRMLLECRDTF